MIHAYDKIYLENARTNLAVMTDFAVNELGYGIDHFYDLFIASGTAGRFERGDYSLITGMSGVELAYHVLEEYGIEEERKTPLYPEERSPEYWMGWALGYYQWETSLGFREIFGAICAGRIVQMYVPFHEMDIRQFCDRMNAIYREINPDTALKKKRQQAGLSQSELALLAGIPVRTLQQYEQRQKNINHANAESLFALSKVLCCRMEDLIEKTA